MAKISVGDWVKIKKEFDPVGGICGERFWVKVTKISKNKIYGKVDNDLLYTHVHGLKDGDKVILTLDDVLTVMKGDEAI